MSLRAWLVSAFVLSLLGCKRPSTSEVASPEDPNVHYVGWFDARAPRAPRFAWAGTQISARFSGTSLRVQLADAPVEDDTRETDWMTVVIDDQSPRTFALAEGLHSYPLAQNLAAGDHRVLLWKRTEAEVGVITFYGFVLDPAAALKPSPKAQRRIVFVGDSLMTGYGNEGANASCRWSAASQNNYETYGARAARELSAEYVAMAWSGKGVTRNYEQRDHLTLPEVYERVIPSESDSPHIPSTSADVVVINLGTNDFFQGLPDEQRFKQAYQALLDSLRKRYPDALFVLGLGPLLADDHPQPNARTLMRTWLASMRAARASSGDTKLAFMEVWSDPAEGIGCDFHPNIETHARFGRELASLLRDRLNW